MLILIIKYCFKFFFESITYSRMQLSFLFFCSVYLLNSVTYFFEDSFGHLFLNDDYFFMGLFFFFKKDVRHFSTKLKINLVEKSLGIIKSEDYLGHSVNDISLLGKVNNKTGYFSFSNSLYGQRLAFIRSFKLANDFLLKESSDNYNIKKEEKLLLEKITSFDPLTIEFQNAVDSYLDFLGRFKKLFWRELQLLKRELDFIELIMRMRVLKENFFLINSRFKLDLTKNKNYEFLLNTTVSRILLSNFVAILNMYILSNYDVDLKKYVKTLPFSNIKIYLESRDFLTISFETFVAESCIKKSSHINFKHYHDPIVASSSYVLSKIFCIFIYNVFPIFYRKFNEKFFFNGVTNIPSNEETNAFVENFILKEYKQVLDSIISQFFYREENKEEIVFPKLPSFSPTINCFFYEETAKQLGGFMKITKENLFLYRMTGLNFIQEDLNFTFVDISSIKYKMYIYDRDIEKYVLENIKKGINSWYPLSLEMYMKSSLFGFKNLYSAIK